MTPRSLLNIVLKVAGIFLLPQTLQTFVQFILAIVNLPQQDWGQAYLYDMLFTFLQVIIYTAIIYVLVVKSNWLIKEFEIDKDFEQTDFSLNIHRSTIISISIIVTGSLIIVDSVPSLTRYLFLYFQNRQMQRDSLGTYKSYDFSYMIIYAVKLVIGLILVGNQKLLTNFIELRRKK